MIGGLTESIATAGFSITFDAETDFKHKCLQDSWKMKVSRFKNKKIS